MAAVCSLIDRVISELLCLKDASRNIVFYVLRYANMVEIFKIKYFVFKTNGFYSNSNYQKSGSVQLEVSLMQYFRPIFAPYGR